MRIYILVFVFSIVHIYVQAYDFEEILPQLSFQDKTILLNSEPVTQASKSSSNKTLHFLPNVKHASNIREYIKKTNPSILYEILLFIPNDKLQAVIDTFRSEQYVLTSDSDTIFSKQNKVILHYYNLLRNITLFSEIQYTNLKNKHVHPLFNVSNRIINKKDKTIISPLNSLYSIMDITMDESIFVLQDMPPFGDVVSQYEYVYSIDDFSFIGKNLTYISYRGFAAVIPKDMFITSQIARTNKGVLIYGLGSVRISGLGIFFGSIINNSFISRMVGFFNWINSQ